MRLPRDLGGEELALLLRRYGYQVSAQTESHRHPATSQGDERHVTIPCHRPLRVGTLNGILTDEAEHLDIERDALAKSLFEK